MLSIWGCFKNWIGSSRSSGGLDSVINNTAWRQDILTAYDQYGKSERMLLKNPRNIQLLE